MLDDLVPVGLSLDSSSKMFDWLNLELDESENKFTIFRLYLHC